MRNTIKDNSVACGIVVSSWDPGEGVSENLVVGNTVIGNSPGPTNLPFIGSIVVAADAPNTTAKNNVVLRNTVIGGWIPGIIVHSNAPGDVVTGTVIAHNRLSDNGVEPGLNAPLPAGINIVSEVLGGPNPSVLRNTLVIWNTVTSDYYGVWHVGDTNTRIIHLMGTATVPVGP
jgi:hypothetical protein